MIFPWVRDLLAQLNSRSPMPEAAEAAAAGRRVSVHGLTPPAQALALVLLQRRVQRPLIVVAHDGNSLEDLRDALETFHALTGTGDERIGVLPGYEIDPYERLSPHPDILQQRAVALWRAAQVGALSQLPFLLASPQAAAARLAAPESYRHLARNLARGGFVDLEGLSEQLLLMGYERHDPVEQAGQFSIRGGLLDVFSPEGQNPVRIELFGDEIESLREFDADTQRSIRPLDSTLLLPLTAMPATAARLGLLKQRLPAGAPELENASVYPGWEFQVPGLENYQHSVFDLTTDPLLVLLEPDLLRQDLERWWEKLRERYAAAERRWRQAEAQGVGLEAGLQPPAPESIYYSPDHWWEMVQALPSAELRELGLHEAPAPASVPMVSEVDLTAEELELKASALLAPVAAGAPEADGGENAATADGQSVRKGADDAVDAASQPQVWHWDTHPTPRFQGNVPRLVEEVKSLNRRGEQLMFVCANLGEVERLADLFREYGVAFNLGFRPQGDDYLTEKSSLGGGQRQNVLVMGRLARGCVFPRQQFALFGSGDLFHAEESYRLRELAPRKSNVSTFLSDFRDLSIGDYVVHVEHGIGQYVGLKTMEADGVAGRGQSPLAFAPVSGAATEFMILEYAEGARLYVPLTRMDLVQKYRSAESGKPTLDRLGGTQWQARKARVKKAMKDMADELLKLYAERQAASIQPCSVDSHWVREFEDSFPYTPTPDQARAIRDVMKDLGRSRPMDRLIVGDVGYGKTEVAMRAAFKIASEGRQVAVLTPTTVLAFQHYQTFKQRFAAFPVSIDMLSRFRTAAQQRETLERLASGKLDIVIGTHRVLSKDVRFQNLGLLVIDEEQRFGVRHKERLKQMKREVHVLSMSATPIPRTLNMSLAGIRDMSVIETPPKDRLAIQTVVAPWSEQLVCAAVEAELERGGQAYFVHNRVDTIWEIAALIQRLVPGARIAVGHGQMDERELERVMLRFIRHEADVLVSTTIIENGLDIPLANTMVVNRADLLGLSELYQLRGRVGRSNRHAYAYLMVPEQGELTPIARKRLAAMREFSDLGAGFKIAALDLELRGAGNLLGGEQSGQIEAVGFDLYVQMLEQAVKELQGQEARPEVDTQIQLGIDVRIPATYIPEENQRLRMYKRLAQAEAAEEQEDALRELTDRYGPPPAPVQNLLEYSRLKQTCRQMGVEALERKRDALWLRFRQQAPIDADRLMRIVRETRGAQFTPQGVLKLPFAAQGTAAVMEATRVLLRELRPRTEGETPDTIGKPGSGKRPAPVQ